MGDNGGREERQRQVKVSVSELLKLQNTVGNRLQAALLWIQNLLNLSPEVAEHPDVQDVVRGVEENTQAAADAVQYLVTRLVEEDQLEWGDEDDE